MKIIYRHDGKELMVDDEDYTLVSSFTWYASGETSLYAATHIRGDVSISMHRFIMGNPEGMHVDHKDGNTFNNCKSNLRVCTRNQNVWNWHHVHYDNTSGYYGISYLKASGRWQGRIRVNGKFHSGGCYATPQDAALARDKLAVKLQGEFVNTNFPLDYVLSMPDPVQTPKSAAHAGYKMHPNNKTGFKGVHFHKATGKYRATIRINGESMELGKYTCPEHAARAYDVASFKYHGEHGWCNFPDEPLYSDEEIRKLQIEGFSKTKSNTGYLGVVWMETHKKYQAYIRIDGKHTYLGLYNTAEEAARTRDESAKKHYGELARLNFP